MATDRKTTLRLSTVQLVQLTKLSKKLGIKRAEVIRFAIARLAEQEGITRPEKG